VTEHRDRGSGGPRVAASHRSRRVPGSSFPVSSTARTRFSIEPLSGGRIRFIHRERFSGVLVELVWRRLDRDTRLGFEAMNAALKARAEAPEG
jgi:hypothetical protein